jgi:hypothetical protein
MRISREAREEIYEAVHTREIVVGERVVGSLRTSVPLYTITITTNGHSLTSRDSTRLPCNTIQGQAVNDRDRLRYRQRLSQLAHQPELLPGRQVQLQQRKRL